MNTYMSKVRSTAPLIHNITNYVTVNDVANILLACGASPIMSDAIEEVEEITSICSGLNINIGTLNSHTIKAMFLAGKKANTMGHKVLLDPVGAGASRLRTETALKLLEELKLDVIRGNISEMKTLAYGSGKTKGVDADLSEFVSEENLDQTIQFAKTFSAQTGSIIVITGAIDLVTDAHQCYVIRNGRPEMGRITGTGCQLSALITAFLAANQNRPLESTAAAVCAMGLAGEIGFKNMESTDGNSTYRNRIIDAIYHMSGDQLAEGARYEIK